MTKELQLLEPAASRAVVAYGGEVEIEAATKLRSVTRNGLIAVAVLVFGIGGLMAFLPMAGAVIATGEVAVESNVRQIAHPYGGVAAEIAVRDGDVVKQGDLLIRLDDTVAGANANFSGLSRDQLLAKAARLRAVRDGSAGIAFPQELRERAAKDPFVASIMADEARGLALERQALADQRRQLQARISQTQATISSASSRSNALARQENLIGQELSQTRELYESQLSTLDRLNALERAAVGVQADRASAEASISEARARIGELQTQIASIGSDIRARAAAELAEVERLITESRVQEVSAADTSERTAIRAPQAGIVNKLAINTIGGVVPAGETLLEIVPAGDQLVVEAHVAVTDIDQVALGQPAFLRFTALPMRTTPELEGKVTQVDANRTTDPATGLTFYTARVEISEAEFAKLGEVRLTVGMPVEVFIQTGERTILSYILRPLTDQLKRALRE